MIWYDMIWYDMIWGEDVKELETRLTHWDRVSEEYRLETTYRRQ
jgi:hypothetical protein